MSQVSNHNRIQTDVAAEKSIIEKHKERQTAILSQIEKFKETMKTQILNLQEQIQNVKVQIAALTTEITQKTTIHNEEKEKLESEIKNFEDQREKNLIEKDKTILNNTNDLNKLTELINGKKTEIKTMQEMNLSKEFNLSEKKTFFEQSEAELTILNSKIVDIKSVIETHKETNKNLIIQDTELNNQIMTDIKSLTETTNEMKIEFETTQQLTSVLNET